MKMVMGDMDMSEVPYIPPVAGYAEGERIFFLHTEVSDPEIGRIMTEMMDSPVPVVASLAKAPEEMLAIVYAFTNGVQPDGPRGPLDFQPDVFDNPPGTPGYTPLRKLVLVTLSRRPDFWADRGRQSERHLRRIFRLARRFYALWSDDGDRRL